MKNVIAPRRKGKRKMVRIFFSEMGWRATTATPYAEADMLVGSTCSTGWRRVTGTDVGFDLVALW